jgi:hypothetical protein
MNVRHTIRLHAAWKRVVGGDGYGAEAVDGAEIVDMPGGALGEPTAVTLPDSFLADCPAGRVTMSRRFNRPTGLDGSSSVVLDCGLLLCADSVAFNGQPLAASEDGTVDITDRLCPHNELEVTIPKVHFLNASLASARLLIVDRP